MSNKQNIWEYVLSKSDIVSIISDYVPLTKKGKNYVACCPFHDEKTPSFSVSPEKNIFKCFGCGKSGNVIKFVEYKDNVSALEATRRLAEKQALNISQYKDFYDKSGYTNEHFKILEVNKSASNFFRYQITFERTTKLEEYLKSRDLNDEIIKEFQIGFASKDKLIYDTLKEHQFDSFEIFNSSLILNYDNKNFFNDRLMFPIYDEGGNIVAFSARDITGLQEPKYLNSAETIVFKKNDVMFNYYHAKDDISKTNEVYLVEGQFDCIALYKAGIKNVVALMGTNLSLNNLKQFQNKTITFFLDNDEAGQNATLKNLKTILENNRTLNISINFVANYLNKDPDEIYKLDKGETLKRLCDNKIDIVEYLFRKVNEINETQNNANTKNIEYKKVFEYINLLEPSLELMLKDKVINNKVLNNDLYDYYKLNFKQRFESESKFYKPFSKERYNGLKTTLNKEYKYKANKDTIQNLNKLNNEYQFISNIVLLALENPKFINYFEDKRIKKIIKEAESVVKNNKEINNDILVNLIDKEFTLKKNKFYPFRKRNKETSDIKQKM
ncbi:DNA primase [Mycoplasmopsis arginini]|uniref:DNA primase n=1 Tax=Mycoplasmopsis arginini TaxID=2094 RepID=A0ABZ2AND6_MYCAR|nr:DNA primase [Mycoplasmopsis arginini]WVN22267.1 DNA primase [Mycoplasmopsis arginini]VEU81675.1 DNA primase [Mycoplasmopsis arginini]